MVNPARIRGKVTPGGPDFLKIPVTFPAPDRIMEASLIGTKTEKMKKGLVLLAFFAGIMAVNAQEKVIKDANAKEIKVGSFEGVEISGGIDLYLSQGTEDKVALSAKDPEDLEKIEAFVENDMLVVRFKKGNSWWSNQWNTMGKHFRAYVSARTLRKVSVAGSGNVDVSGIIKSERFALDLAGSGNFEGDVKTDKMEVNQAGSSNVRIGGSAEEASFTTSGSGNVMGYEMVVDNCNVSISGSGNIQITANKELSAATSGSGNVSYRGSAVIRNLSSSGSGRIRKVD